MKKAMILVAAAAAAFALGTSSAALACGGNACGPTGGQSFGAWGSSGGKTSGWGNGSAWTENAGSGPVVDRFSSAMSESGFTGGFDANSSSCGGCAPNSVTTNAGGFTNQFAGGGIETSGGRAVAGSRVGGAAAGRTAAGSRSGNFGN